MKLRSLVPSVLGLMVLHSVATPCAAQDVAVVMAIGGTVLRASPGSGPDSLRVADGLAEGDRLLIEDDGYARVFLVDSGVDRTVRQSMTITAGDLAPDRALSERVDQAFRTLSSPRPPTSGMRGALRPAAGQPVMLLPPVSANVLSTPEFHWRLEPGELDLVFRIRAEDARDWTVFRLGRTDRWTLPPDFELRRGVWYRWTVNTEDYLREPVFWRFRILPEEEIDSVEAFRRELAQLGLADQMGGLLLLAAFMQELRVPSEQLAILDRLEAEAEGALGAYFYRLRANAHFALGNVDLALADVRRATR